MKRCFKRTTRFFLIEEQEKEAKPWRRFQIKVDEVVSLLTDYKTALFDMSEVISQHCTLFEQWKNDGQSEQNREDILNDLQTELTRLKTSNVAVFREQLEKVTGYLADNILNLSDEFLEFLIESFIDLLKQWRQSPLDFDNRNTFDNLTKIFSEHDDAFKNQLVVDEFVECLYTIARLGKPIFEHSNIRMMTELIRKYVYMQSNGNRDFMYQSKIDDGIVKCLCSSYTPEVFTQLISSYPSEDRTQAEFFVFHGLFHYTRWINRESLEKYSFQLREHLLKSVSDLLDVYVETSSHWSTSSLAILTTVTVDFLYSVQMTIPKDIHVDVQKHICDVCIRILLLPTCISTGININCAQYLYIGTLNDKVLDHLKSQQLTQTMFQIGNLYKTTNDIQFNVYRILAAIMTEEDIKRLDNPGEIANVFLKQLDQIKDMNGWETRITNLLTSLKSNFTPQVLINSKICFIIDLLQHDQLRDEIFQLNGLPLFIYCTTQSKYPALLQQRALENLLIMAFSETVRSNLKANEQFMTHLKNLSENSNESDLKRAGESLLWFLTKEETSKTSSDQQTSNKTYDIMISYSHKDKDLCFQIYDRLVKDKFRVWLDREQMHGTPLESMSNAIENAEFVFLCMSDAYKQSGYCKMEAYYALERQCSIIPLVMKAQYKPDGWLGIVVTGRMRIDFPKYGFDDGYKKLLVEINRNRQEKKQTTNSMITHHEIPTNNIKIESKKLTLQAKK